MPHILEPYKQDAIRRHAILEARAKMRRAVEAPIKLPKVNATVTVSPDMVESTSYRPPSLLIYGAVAFVIAVAGVLTVAYRPHIMATPLHEFRDYAPAR